MTHEEGTVDILRRIHAAPSFLGHEVIWLPVHQVEQPAAVAYYHRTLSPREQRAGEGGYLYVAQVAELTRKLHRIVWNKLGTIDAFHGGIEQPPDLVFFRHCFITIGFSSAPGRSNPLKNIFRRSSGTR